MAGDLIPGATPPAGARAARPYAERFGALMAGLALVLVGAAVGAWALQRHDRPAAWSAFRPSGDDPVKRAQQIAAQVAQRYLSAPGTPVATINAGEDVIPDLPGRLQVVAVTDVNQGPVSFEYYQPGESGLVFYKLCGPLPGCTLDPAASRPVLVTVYAREALELALYSLKYIDQADGAIVELPTGFEPPATAGAPLARQVFYFPRKRVEHLLDTPLSKTFPADPPPSGQFTGADLGSTKPLVQSSLYRMDIVRAGDASSITYQLSAVPAQ